MSSKNTAHLREVVPQCQVIVIPRAGHEITVADYAGAPRMQKIFHDYVLQFARGVVSGDKLTGSGRGIGSGGGSSGENSDNNSCPESNRRPDLNRRRSESPPSF